MEALIGIRFTKKGNPSYHDGLPPFIILFVITPRKEAQPLFASLSRHQRPGLEYYPCCNLPTSLCILNDRTAHLCRHPFRNKHGDQNHDEDHRNLRPGQRVQRSVQLQADATGSNQS